MLRASSQYISFICHQKLMYIIMLDYWKYGSCKSKDLSKLVFVCHVEEDLNFSQIIYFSWIWCNFLESSSSNFKRKIGSCVVVASLVNDKSRLLKVQNGVSFFILKIPFLSWGKCNFMDSLPILLKIVKCCCYFPA